MKRLFESEVTEVKDGIVEIKKEELNKITIPTLVFAGEFDLIKEEETHFISENIKYSVERIIRNGTHFLLRDEFRKTCKEIQMFLEACHKESL